MAKTHIPCFDPSTNGYNWNFDIQKVVALIRVVTQAMSCEKNRGETS